eukprot:808834-Pyramimonas_sp.AAC.1
MPGCYGLPCSGMPRVLVVCHAGLPGCCGLPSWPAMCLWSVMLVCRAAVICRAGLTCRCLPCWSAVFQ